MTRTTSVPALCAAALASVLSAPGFVASASACDSDEIALFYCQTEDPENSIALCAKQNDEDGDPPFTGIRYVYETAKGVEISYPPDPADGPGQLLFSHLFRDDLYEARVRFGIGGYGYTIFYEDSPPSMEPDTVNGPTAGVEIRKVGRTISTISCGERPASYFEDIRKLTSCDMRNPFGAAGCSDDPPSVK